VTSELLEMGMWPVSYWIWGWE